MLRSQWDHHSNLTYNLCLHKKPQWWINLILLVYYSTTISCPLKAVVVSVSLSLPLLWRLIFPTLKHITITSAVSYHMVVLYQLARHISIQQSWTLEFPINELYSPKQIMFWYCSVFMKWGHKLMKHTPVWTTKAKYHEWAIKMTEGIKKNNVKQRSHFLVIMEWCLMISTKPVLWCLEIRDFSKTHHSWEQRG